MAYIQGSNVDFSKARRGSVLKFPYPCGDNKQNCYPYEGILPKGIYKFEVYGAEGGRAKAPNSQQYSNGGFGGYSKGILDNPSDVPIFITVGATGINSEPNQGGSLDIPSVFNGGGSGRKSSDTEYMASSGGGASDIRLIENDVNHRLIVAGGGGGTGYYKEIIKGGNGGGQIGGTGQKIETEEGGIGATQSSGASFGYGGNHSETIDGCGGGGGWYGGNAGTYWNNGGGGGSGFVFTSENQNIATNAQLKLSSSYYLTSAETSTYEHTSDGMIIITVLFIKEKAQISCNYPQIFHSLLIFVSIYILRS